jgi:Ca2+-binding RTX toxin-like protein
VLDGGTGNDTYVARHFNVTLVEGPGGGTDTLIVYNAWTLPAEVENLTIGTTTNLNGFGNALANRMTGNDATNTFSAFDGNDTLFGRGGTDVLNGGAGNDSLDGGADDDVLVGGPGLDRLIGGDGADSFTFNSEADSLPTTRDQILDFKQTVDRIVLNGFDANAILEGAQFFKFIGSGPFSVNSPGLLRVQSVDATSCLLFGNTDNDVAPEFSVYVRGAETLTESDFVL